MKTRLRALCALLAIFATGSAHANPQWCNGAVSAVYVDSAGHLYLLSDFRNDWLQACNVHGSWGGITPETCMTWYSMLTAARVHNQQITVMYYTATACNALPTYGNAPAPAYVMIRRP